MDSHDVDVVTRIVKQVTRLKTIIEPLEKYSDEDLELIMDNVEDNRVLFYRILERYVQYIKEERGLFNNDKCI